MMMAILTPADRRHRRRRRAGRAGVVGCLLLLACGAWATVQAQGRYEVLLVDTQSGRVVTRAAAEDLRLPPQLKRGLQDGVDSALRQAAARLAEQEEDHAAPPAAPVSRPTAPVLAGGPAVGPPQGLKILVTDAWASPDAILLPPPDSPGVDLGEFP